MKIQLFNGIFYQHYFKNKWSAIYTLKIINFGIKILHKSCYTYSQYFCDSFFFKKFFFIIGSHGSYLHIKLEQPSYGKKIF